MAISHLNEDEMDELDNYLVTDAPDESLNLEALDGLFVCMAIGPGQVSQEDLERTIWGPKGRGNAPERILFLIEKHRLSVLDQLTNPDTDEEYGAVVYTPDPEPSDDDTESGLGEDWAFGFSLGMEIHEHEWDLALQNQDFQSLIIPVILLESGEHPADDKLVVNHAARRELVEVLPEICLGIKAYFHPETAN